MGDPLPASPQPAGDPRTILAAYLFASDWTGARELVENDPWLLSREAMHESAQMLAELKKSALQDKQLALAVPLMELGFNRLARARVEGASAAFGDLEELEHRLRILCAASSLGQFHARILQDPSLLSDQSVDVLKLLVIRTLAREGEGSTQQIDRAYAIVLRCRREGLGFLAHAEAAEIAAILRQIPPQNATDETVAQCEQALSLLEGEENSPLWIELQVCLGNFLLESPHGDRASNVARAQDAYRKVLSHASLEGSFDTWVTATSGMANSLISNPAGKPESFDEAFHLFDDLISAIRPRADSDKLAHVLSCYSQALANSPSGDSTENLERAIVLQKEAIGVIPRESDPFRWGRMKHNLGALYYRRQRGARSQNIDSAITVLREVLSVRTAEADPVGRCRTLRALALAYPRWSGADSLAHGEQLASAALEEAEQIEQSDTRAAVRKTGWAGLARQRSALEEDLDEALQLPPTSRVDWLEKMIANHRAALDITPRQTMPVRWSEWMGGLGRMLGQLGRLGRSDALQEAYICFQQALAAVTSNEQPRLWLQLQRRLGELCHQIGDWEGAHRAYASALQTSAALFDEAGAPESRARELADSRGYALLAAYAAARSGLVNNAVCCAEMGRARSLVESLAASELAFSHASEPVRAEVIGARHLIADLEQKMRQAEAGDPAVIAVNMLAKLADSIGGDPALLQSRVTNEGVQQLDAGLAEYVRLSAELRQSRAALRQALARARKESGEILPVVLSATDIVGVATKAGYPIIYLFATMHGSMALAVSPAGSIEAIQLGLITSDDTRALLYGTENGAGFLDGATYGNEERFGTTLEECLPILRERVVVPIVGWIAKQGFARAALIPLGSLGLLPIHAATANDEPALSYVPSARVLSRALALWNQRVDAQDVLFAVGDPSRDDEPALRCAVAEVKGVARLFGQGNRATVLVGPQAETTAVHAGMSGATYLHFACHGRFRPSDPLESMLLLAGENRLTLGELLRGELDVSAARLIVLSACQTTNTEFRLRPDESLGFPAALLVAGVPGVVSTLWPVDDRVAALFCIRFYEEHLQRGQAPAVAVYKAQHWLQNAGAEELGKNVESLRAALDPDDDEVDEAMSAMWRDLARRDPDHKPFSAPQFWAAFTYTGA
jgi:CHAT domain-containing protein/tetratricopeptide (TPR) repeat protein